ncbi:unnamed protein product [Peronospora destructor]|uniref:Essential protein Yae1 N-terminal domain-containing protein n=1 Tax=Peronospora destructor TaxID=86335 RepID=A0AAV0UK56_9STRA|nr:unnamed protein product [Peronospora destructor]
MAGLLDSHRHSDDGFQDFLSEDEEKEALLNQESVALERRMKTMGIRDGLELGKEGTLQEGFDQGFAEGATRCFGFGRLRGALGTAAACGLFDETTMTQAWAYMSQLRTLEKDTSQVNDHTNDVTELERHAEDLLRSIGVDLPTSSRRIVDREDNL